MTGNLENDPLAGLLDAAALDGPMLDATEVARLFASVSDGSAAALDEFLDAVARTCSPEWDDDAIPAEQLGLRLGHWRIDLRREGVRGGLLTAVAAVALAQRGLAEFGIAFATAVLPSVFDIERVELSAGDHKLLVELRAKPAFREGFATADELYASLPGSTREQINPYDFADFVERLREAGLTDEVDAERVRLRDSDRPVPTIRFR